MFPEDNNSTSSFNTTEPGLPGKAENTSEQQVEQDLNLGGLSANEESSKKGSSGNEEKDFTD